MTKPLLLSPICVYYLQLLLFTDEREDLYFIPLCISDMNLFTTNCARLKIVPISISIYYITT